MLKNTNKRQEQGNKDLKGLGLNTILYGPPGTGKTYNAVMYAVAICDAGNEKEKDIGEYFEKLRDKEYSEVLKRYRELVDNERVRFVTFHQSYGYEEFIEGIKPLLVSEAENEEESEDIEDTEDTESNEKSEEKDIKYVIADGIFKKLCAKASEETVIDPHALGIAKDAFIWPVGKDDIDNNTEDKDKKEGTLKFRPGKALTLQRPMQPGDLIITYENPTYVNPKSKKDKKETGFITGIAVINDNEINKTGTSQDTSRDEDIKKTTMEARLLTAKFKEKISEALGRERLRKYARVKGIGVGKILRIAKRNPRPKDKTLEEAAFESYTTPHVLIVDEINRGNISKIFGELITLIEPSKRAGSKEAMSAVLPYSGEPFSVPKNVYIIGTMNTADRSIALMDTALRRRFDFKEMMPDLKLLENIRIKDHGETLELQEMLEKINERIECLYDREHTIGHAFFMKLKNNPNNPDIGVLAEIFKKNIIPLLQEYFYEDYGKIQLVLGDNQKEDDKYKFVNKNFTTKDLFGQKANDIDLDTVEKYEINKDAFMEIKSYIGIYDPQKAKG